MPLGSWTVKCIFLSLQLLSFGWGFGGVGGGVADRLKKAKPMELHFISMHLHFFFFFCQKPEERG